MSKSEDAIKNLAERGFNIEKLVSFRDIAESVYAKDLKRMRLLDGVDKGRFWDIVKAKKPAYQILPDTNHIARVKNGLLASIYTVTKGANFAPTSAVDASLITNVNTFIDVIWQKCQVGYYQFLAGERASLLNLGITQVGFDSKKKEIVLKNVDPTQFRRDPFANELDTAAYCYKFDYLHKSVIQANPHYKAAFNEYLEKNGGEAPPLTMNNNFGIRGRDRQGSAKDYFTVAVFWVRDAEKIHEIHTINYEQILYAKEDIQPAMFPFAMLYCNTPAGDLIGTSPCAQILSNSIVYNLMESIMYTADYKNQRPPKFVNSASGINVDTFMRHGDEADRTFIVNNNAKDAVYYHQFPQVSPALSMQLQKLSQSVGDITGVDDRYTGRDTGSITTTGGTADMLSRVTLIDAPKIVLYEKYTVELSRLIIWNYFKWNASRKMFYQDPSNGTWKVVDVDLAKLDEDALLEYEINISSELPRNKQALAAKADMLMQHQIQYMQSGQDVDLITPEEWLMMQDLGQAKEYMLKRMGAQRMMDATRVTAQVISNYEELMGGGMPPEEAMMQTASALEQVRQGTSPEQVMPADDVPVNTANGGSII